MAAISKRGDSWRAHIRRIGHKSISGTFPTKAQAVAWARGIEAEMDAKRFKDAHGLANLTLKALVERYEEEIGAEHPFGKNKAAVYRMWKNQHGDKTLDELTDEYMTKFVLDRRKGGPGGVTISIDLTCLAGVLKTAKEL